MKVFIFINKTPILGNNLWLKKDAQKNALVVVCFFLEKTLIKMRRTDFVGVINLYLSFVQCK